ncbi:hypothetical protein [Zavarzinia compransoris]|uniref:Carboxymuconolactone decarboxylase-like domain-containing protein n=1 Tax=Zavarzinia compransoris TaxID=1264899 RepID=A0A317E0N7_9PROT|nr:hypothetical protein [Zavarzinia compransoris]PWR19686.1 hypothetical protein DKG75_14555 [Zavarzinia compransoris]TDP43369.1 hypothetical protein DES42_11270 [Zavarzinia compransoris]
MLRWLYARLIDRSERRLGQSADWLRDILDSSPAGFRKFGLFMALAGHRAHAPAALWHLSRIAADQTEDCGPCVQIAVDAALAAGVDPGLLRAAVARRPEAMGDLESLTYRFAAAVAAGGDEAEELRQALEARLGRAAMADLAIAIATARVFPALKRGLGHARSCRRVEVRVKPA